MITIDELNIGDTVIIQQKFNSPRIQRLFGVIYEVKIVQFSQNKHLFRVEEYDGWLKIEEYNILDKV